MLAYILKSCGSHLVGFPISTTGEIKGERLEWQLGDVGSFLRCRQYQISSVFKKKKRTKRFVWAGLVTGLKLPFWRAPTSPNRDKYHASEE